LIGRRRREAEELLRAVSHRLGFGFLGSHGGKVVEIFDAKSVLPVHRKDLATVASVLDWLECRGRLRSVGDNDPRLDFELGELMRLPAANGSHKIY
jgi:hypothetical protein